ncbi:MAG: c-type cytochrome [Fibrobacteria bacterium]
MRFHPIVAGMLAVATIAAANGKALGGHEAKKASQLEEGRKVFEINCVACHGAEGKGDGVAAAALEPKPRNFTDAAYMKARPVATLRQVITEGGQSVGLSPIMVGWKASLTGDQIESVLKYVQSFSKPAKKGAKVKQAAH